VYECVFVCVHVCVLLVVVSQLLFHHIKNQGKKIIPRIVHTEMEGCVWVGWFSGVVVAAQFKKE